jgi:hypothetical protein
LIEQKHEDVIEYISFSETSAINFILILLNLPDENVEAKFPMKRIKTNSKKYGINEESFDAMINQAK